MSGKQMEGDNQRRRTRAKRAHEEGRTPSAKDVTLGASKQREREPQARRTGPPPAGAHKPTTHDPAQRRLPRPERQWPRSAPIDTGDGEAGVQYRELIAAVSGETGVPFDQGRQAGEATVTVLARALAPDDRERLLEAVPAELHDDNPTATPCQPVDLADFLGQIASLAHESPEQARHQAQAVLSVLRQQNPALVDSLTLPEYLADLLPPPPVGGGVVGPAGGPAPLSGDEVRAALDRLPRWSGDQRALTRTIALPPDNLARVLERLADLKRELGRGPKISRDGDGTATLTVRTGSVEAVTAGDIDLARRVDDAIDEAGAGMNAG
jgi:pterin-4a-carbinolamine dehydratase